MPCCEISDRTQMSKTIVRHFGLGGRESLESAVSDDNIWLTLLGLVTQCVEC